MDFLTFEHLKWIDKHLEQRGKILQLILTRSLVEGGAELTESTNLVEGKDVHISINGNKYGLEVKTTDNEEIKLLKKDREEIEEMRGEDFIPGFAFLRIHTNSKWRITTAEPYQIQEKFKQTVNLPVTSAIPKKINNLQNLANEHFDEIMRQTVQWMKKERLDETTDALSQLRTHLNY